MLQRVRSFNQNLNSIIGDAIGETSDDYIGLVQSQLERGEDKDGNLLRPYAWKEYAEYKQRKFGTDKTNLKDTGSFYNKMFVSIDANTVTLKSADYKYTDLIFVRKGYGEEVMMLNKSNKTAYTANSLQPMLVKRFKELTGAE
jgi:hypothetical protein